MEFNLNPITTPLNLDCTLDCGQVFRWNKVGNDWWGIVDGSLIQISQKDNKLFGKFFSGKMNEKFLKEYLRLDDDLPSIIQRINKDKIIELAINRFHGLRLIRQNPWECLISFICATYSNIPRIKRMIQSLCQQFGQKIRYEKHIYHAFPGVRSLAEASINQLLACNLGYRARYIKEVAQSFLKDQVNICELRKTSYKEARKVLLTFKGVGYKVADCVLLFSLEKLEAFPVDVRIRRVLFTHYRHHFDTVNLKKKNLTPRIYSECRYFGRKYYGKYAGYAQEYLYANYSHQMTNHESSYTYIDN